MLRILLRTVRSTLRDTSPGAPADAQLAAVSFLHRFGSSLNPHFHFHIVVVDGLFSQADDGALRFHAATSLGSRDVERLVHTVQCRVLRHFVRRGLLDDTAASDMLTWQAAGGFSLDASVRVEGHDRAGRERLLRYCARPPFALERLDVELAPSPTAARKNATVRRVRYRPPRPTPDGRTVLTLSPLEFLDAAVTAWAREATRVQPLLRHRETLLA